MQILKEINSISTFCFTAIEPLCLRYISRFNIRRYRPFFYRTFHLTISSPCRYQLLIAHQKNFHIIVGLPEFIFFSSSRFLLAYKTSKRRKRTPSDFRCIRNSTNAIYKTYCLIYNFSFLQLPISIFLCIFNAVLTHSVKISV